MRYTKVCYKHLIPQPYKYAILKQGLYMHMEMLKKIAAVKRR